MRSIEYLRKFSTIQLVKGAKRSLVCDLQRSEFSFVDNGIYEFLQFADGKAVSEIESAWADFPQHYIRPLIDLLLQREIVFLTHDPALFPEIDLQIKFPGLLSNCILEMDDMLVDLFEKIITELAELGVIALEWRFFEPVDPEHLDALLQRVKHSPIQDIRMFLKYDANLTDEFLHDLVREHLRVNSILVHGSDRDAQLESRRSNLAHTRNTITASTCCGVISAAYFTLNISLFSESLHANSCLNRKVAITRTGDIKNCPSLPESYGNIYQNTIREALQSTGFDRYWNITKDQIKTCRDCEFRHICTDCRAFLENPEDLFSAPLKCGYDPYTCKWEEWSENPLKQDAMAFYAMQNLCSFFKQIPEHAEPDHF